MNEIDEKAHKRLQQIDTRIISNLVGHDRYHAIAHSGNEKYDANAELKVLRTSPLHEAITTIYQNILTNGDLSLDSLREEISMSFLLDSKVSIESKARKDFFNDNFSNIDKDKFGEELIDWQIKKYRVNEEKLFRRYTGEYPPLDSTPEQLRNTIINHSCFSTALDSNTEYSDLPFSGEKMVRLDIKEYKQAMFEKDFTTNDSEAKKQCDAIDNRIISGDYSLPMSEQAFEYNVMRATLIKEQLQPFFQEKKAATIGELTSQEFAEIPSELLFISREEVKNALVEKHGEFSIKSDIPQTNIFSKDALHDSPKRQNLVRTI